LNATRFLTSEKKSLKEFVNAIFFKNTCSFEKAQHMFLKKRQS